MNLLTENNINNAFGVVLQNVAKGISVSVEVAEEDVSVGLGLTVHGIVKDNIAVGNSDGFLSSRLINRNGLLLVGEYDVSKASRTTLSICLYNSETKHE